MVELMFRNLRVAVSALGLFVLTVSSAAATETNADALAQKFIDGPAREAREAEQRQDRERQRRLQQMRDQELDSLSRLLKRARDAHAARDGEPVAGPEPGAPRRAVSRTPRSAETTDREAGARYSETEPKSIDPDGSVSPLSRHHPTSKSADVSDPTLREFEDERSPWAKTEPTVQRVAVLLLLKPSRRSSRRFERTADPIICFGDSCYISGGADGNAKEMIRRRALGPRNSLGRRAGACRRSPRCVFRNITLDGRRAMIQPIDLGWIRHDRRRPTEAAIDPTCAVVKDRLSCEWAIDGPDYRVWMVPETLARRVGSRGLMRALESGLSPVKQHVGLPANTAQSNILAR